MLYWNSIEWAWLLLRLLAVLLLELLRNSRDRWLGASLEGLLLRSTGLEGLLQGSASLEGLLLGSASLERLLLRSASLEGLLQGSSRLARESGELGLELPRSLRLRLLQARISGVLILKGLLWLTEAGGLGSEGARLLLLLLLAWLLAERASSILLRLTGSEAVAAHVGVGL